MNTVSIRQLSAAPVFFRFSEVMQRILFPVGLLISVLGVAYALLGVPVDAEQGEVYRIIYLHVPAAWMSMFLYLVAALYAGMYWIWGTDVSASMMRAFLPTGAWMTALALITGSLWGKPTWGTYWVWDARLTSELLLLFIYLGLIALQNMMDDDSKVDRILAVGIVIGVVNIPLIYVSVIYWNTLHQGMSMGAPGASRMAPDMKWTLLACVMGFWLLCASNVLYRARLLIVERCAHAGWVKEIKL